MLLQELTLVDFQAHALTQLEFAPGITTIKGPTDKGKSAILRALRWVAQNNLSGEAFIREGQKETEVTLVVQDGKVSHEMVRRKGKHNTYELDGKQFAAFGVNVPADIAKVLNLNAINFQGQHDAPFWFAESAPEVSRQLNSVIDLSVIDTTLSNIGMAVRRAAERESFCNENLSTIQDQVAECEPQRQRSTDWERLQSKRKEFHRVKTDLDSLGSLLDRIRAYQNCQAGEQAVQGQEALTKMLAARQAQRRVAELQDILHQISKAQANITPPPNFTPVLQARSAFGETCHAVERLKLLLAKLDKEQAGINSRVGAIKVRQNLLYEYIKGKTCPLCHKALTQ